MCVTCYRENWEKWRAQEGERWKEGRKREEEEKRPEGTCSQMLQKDT